MASSSRDLTFIVLPVAPLRGLKRCQAVEEEHVAVHRFLREQRPERDDRLLEATQLHQSVRLGIGGGRRCGRVVRLRRR